jgi:N-acetylmuramoyl-L-alanine amidase
MFLVCTSSAGRELRKRMPSRRAWFPAPLLVFAGILGQTVVVPPAAFAGPEVQKVRHWTGPEYTRIVIDLSARVSYRHSITTADPPSIIVELEGASIGAAVQPATVGDGLVGRVRFLGPEAGVAQIVIELTARRRVTVFALAAEKGKPHRLVVDVLRGGAPEVAQASDASPADAVPGHQAVPAPAGRPAGSPAASRPSGEGSRPRVVVIDPGHGGDDPGARGPGGLWEKDICLALGRSLAAELNRRPGIKAYLSRDGDHFLTLRRRTRLAAEKKADLFVSIHANANRSRKVRGTEVYFLSLRGASDAEARELATRENAADEVAGVPPDSQEDIENIVMDLMRTAALERSSELATTVIERLREDSQLEIRGVKQAGFDVLKTAGMPSILIEAAFISHPKEAKLLQSRDFQRRFGSLVGSAIVDYLTRTAAAEGPHPAIDPAAAGTEAAASPAGS